MSTTMKLRQRILLGYLAPLLLLLAAMTVVFVNLQTADRISTQRYHSQQVMFAAQNITLDLVKLQRATRGYILYKSPVFQKSIQDILGDYRSKMESLKSLVTDAQQQETLRSFDQVGKSLTEILKTEIDLVDAGKPDEAAKMLSNRGISESQELDELWGRFQQRENDLLKALNDDTEAAMDMVRNSIIYGMLAAIVLALAVAFWISSVVSRSITANVTQLSAAAS